MTPQTTIDALIRKLERARKIHGGDAIVMIDGHDEGGIEIIPNNDFELYPDAVILLVV